MATVQRASMIQYPDGQVAIHNIRKKRLSIPVFGPNESYSATLVNSWWDGTPMDDSKADGNVYFKLKKLPEGADSGLSQYIGSYFKVNLPNDGEYFLEKDTMQEMRDLNSTEILLLQMGYYKGVKLNGYHAKGDTPAPIEYTLSSTSESDDGGSVVETGGIKLEHNFKGRVDLRYYGVRGNGSDETASIQVALNKAIGGVLYVPAPNTEYLSGQIIIPSDVVIECEAGVVWKAVDTLIQTPVSQFEVLFRFQDSKNVTFIGNGATFYMNKGAYSGEHNHVFGLNRADNIEIHSCNANSSGGDGFYIAGLRESTNPTGLFHSKNIRIINCTADDNRRQGMSIVGVDGILVDGFIATNTGGTAPGAGIDIEPNSYTDLCTNIIIRNTRCINNNGIGFELAYFNYDKEDTVTDKDNLNILIENCYTLGNSHAYQIRGIKETLKGRVEFNNCVAEDSRFGAFVERGKASTIRSVYRNCTAINCNTSNNSARDGVFNSGFIAQGLLFDGVRFTDVIGNTKFDNCTVISNKPTSGLTRGISTVDTHSSNWEKYDITGLDTVGISQEVYSDRDVVKALKLNRIEPVKENYTSNRSLGASDTEKTFTNAGATGSVVFTLPQGVPGLEYTFRVEAPQNVVITKGPVLILGISRTNTDAINSNQVGDYLTIRSREDGNWDVLDFKGRWGLTDVSQSNNRPEGVRAGHHIFNTSISRPEWYTGSEWVQAVPEATPFVKGTVNSITATENIDTPDATDEATAIALANANKAKINELLTKFRAAGLIAE